MTILLEALQSKLFMYHYGELVELKRTIPILVSFGLFSCIENLLSTLDKYFVHVLWLGVTLTGLKRILNSTVLLLFWVARKSLQC